MDIAALSMDMSQVSLQNEVQLSLMRMAVEDSNVINEKMNDMIDNMAIDINLGTKIDVKC